MEYQGEVATIQRRLAETSDIYRRRLAVLDAIAARPGQRVLEVGCGGGAMLPHLAAAVGQEGHVVGVDISADQVEAANERCRNIDWVSAEVQDVNQLPYDDASFDAIVAIQVIEYLDDPAKALSEIRRVCSAQGRLAILATIWDTVFWSCGAPELTSRIQKAWREHAPYPNLPADLRPLLSASGFQVVRQSPVTIINGSYNEDVFAYWLARLMLAYAKGRDLISSAEADLWIEELEIAEKAGSFLFCSIPVLTLATAR